jgi:PAS domain S-box-containing protein
MVGRRSFDQVPAVLWTTDSTLRVKQAAGAEVRALGLDPVELEGATLCELFSVQAEEEAISAHRRALAGETVSFDLDWHGKQLRAVVQPFKERDETIGVIGLAVDEIGSGPERSFAESMSDGRVRASRGGEGLVAVDPWGRVTFATRAAASLLGCMPRELVGRHIHHAVHAPGEQELWHPVGGCEIEALVTDGRPHHVARDLFYRPEGSRFPAEYITSPMYEEGELTGTVVIFKDLTSAAAPQEATSGADLVALPDVGEGMSQVELATEAGRSARFG